LALAGHQQIFGHSLADERPIDTETGEILPSVTIVTDNGGGVPLVPFRGVHRRAPANSPTCAPE